MTQPLRTPYKDDVRSLDQNALMWVLLGDISKKLQWPVDGKLQKLTTDDWKDILTAGLTKEQRIAQGINGGFVMLGSRTRRMTKPQMGELIEFIYYFMVENGVQLSAPDYYAEWYVNYRGK